MFTAFFNLFSAEKGLAAARPSPALTCSLAPVDFALDFTFSFTREASEFVDLVRATELPRALVLPPFSTCAASLLTRGDDAVVDAW